jgi:hypothetical protein
MKTFWFDRKLLSSKCIFILMKCSVFSMDCHLIVVRRFAYPIMTQRAMLEIKNSQPDQQIVLSQKVKKDKTFVRPSLTW